MKWQDTMPGHITADIAEAEPIAERIFRAYPET
jgi:hypothetical protein